MDSMCRRVHTHPRTAETFRCTAATASITSSAVNALLTQHTETNHL